MSDTSDAVRVIPRKRIHSVIIREEVFRERERRHDNARAFDGVIPIYIANKFISPVRSSLACLDLTNPSSLHRWTPDSVCIVVDTEHAIEKALKNDVFLLDKFWQWFVLEEVDPISAGSKTVEESKLHGEIVQRCGREFRRRGLYPIARYFHILQRSPSSRQLAAVA